MYKYICERCKARLDPGEKCNCEDVGKLAQRIVVMNKGKVELLGKPSEVFKEVETLEKILR